MLATGEYDVYQFLYRSDWAPAARGRACVREDSLAADGRCAQFALLDALKVDRVEIAENCEATRSLKTTTKFYCMAE
jgi:hypothetical protein